MGRIYRMHRIHSPLHAFFLLMLVTCLLTGCGGGDDGAHINAAPSEGNQAYFEGGLLNKAGTISIARLAGSYHEMGRQYGLLLKEELHAFYARAIEEFYMGKEGFTWERLRVISRGFYELYPEEYREFFTGMAETSGLDLDRVCMLSAVELMPTLDYATPRNNCSALAAWGDYTLDGRLIFGRNDEDPLPRDFSRYLVVTILKPLNQTTAVAIINFPGVMYCATGFSSRGIFLEINTGPWGGYVGHRIPTPLVLYEYLQHNSSMSSLEGALLSTQANMNLIVNLADPDGACSYECSIAGTKKREAEVEGFLASTNSYRLPDWGEEPQEDERYDNLLALRDRYKGQFDLELVKRILETPVEDGGPTVTDILLFQVVASPSELKIWIRLPDIQDWTEIDLGRFFHYNMSPFTEMSTVQRGSRCHIMTSQDCFLRKAGAAPSVLSRHRGVDYPGMAAILSSWAI